MANMQRVRIAVLVPNGPILVGGLICFFDVGLDKINGSSHVIGLVVKRAWMIQIIKMVIPFDQIGPTQMGSQQKVGPFLVDCLMVCLGPTPFFDPSVWIREPSCQLP